MAKRLARTIAEESPGDGKSYRFRTLSSLAVATGIVGLAVLLVAVQIVWSVDQRGNRWSWGFGPSLAILALASLWLLDKFRSTTRLDGQQMVGPRSPWPVDSICLVFEVPGAVWLVRRGVGPPYIAPPSR